MLLCFLYGIGPILHSSHLPLTNWTNDTLDSQNAGVSQQVRIGVCAYTHSFRSAKEAERWRWWPRMCNVEMRSLHWTSSPSGPPLKADSAILKPDSSVTRPGCTRIWVEEEGNSMDHKQPQMSFPFFLIRNWSMSFKDRGKRRVDILSCSEALLLKSFEDQQW